MVTHNATAEFGRNSGANVAISTRQGTNEFHGDIYYFQAQVMTFKIGVGNVDQVTSATINLELTTSSTGIGVVEDLA